MNRDYERRRDLLLLHADSPPPWTPAALGLVLALRKGVGVTTSGGLVTAWADQSASGTDATQGTVSMQPAFDALTQSVVFDGSDDYLGIDNRVVKSLDRHTIVLCLRIDAGGAEYGRIFMGGNVNTGVGLFCNGAYGSRDKDSRHRLTGCTPNQRDHLAVWTNVLQIFIVRYDGSNSSASVNGGAWHNVPATGNTSVASGAVAAIGGDPASAASIKGVIDDILVYNRALTDDECASTYAGLKALRGTP